MTLAPSQVYFVFFLGVLCGNTTATARHTKHSILCGKKNGEDFINQKSHFVLQREGFYRTNLS
jgi:hypothetical protein